MKKTIDIVKVIALIFVSLLAFHILHFYFPSNIISKVLRATGVVLTPILIALVILYLVSPLTRRLIVKHKMNKKAAIFITMLIFFVVFVGLFGFVVYFIVEQGMLLYDQVTDPNFLSQIETWFDNNGLISIYDAIYDYVINFDLTTLLGPINSIFAVLFQGVATIILVPIFLWHFLNFDENIINSVQSNIPNKWRNTVIPIVYESNDIVSAYFRSKIISIIVLFVMFVFTYLILGLPIGYVILFAFLISVLDIIPYIGPTVGLVIPFIYIFSVGGTNILYIDNWYLNALVTNILLFGINVVIQFVQGNIIIPGLSGKEMNINPALILIFMLFLGYILGIWGVILAIPLGGIIIVIWKKIKTLEFFNN